MKTKQSPKTIRQLTRPDRIEIMKRVAANESIKAIAADFGIRYASIRNVVLSEWQKSYPKHFAKAPTPRTVSEFKNNPPSFK